MDAELLPQFAAATLVKVKKSELLQMSEQIRSLLG